MITLLFLFIKMVVMLPIYMIYLLFKIVLMPFTFLFGKPKEEKETETWYFFI